MITQGPPDSVFCLELWDPTCREFFVNRRPHPHQGGPWLEFPWRHLPASPEGRQRVKSIPMTPSVDFSPTPLIPGDVPFQGPPGWPPLLRAWCLPCSWAASRGSQMSLGHPASGPAGLPGSPSGHLWPRMSSFTFCPLSQACEFLFQVLFVFLRSCVPGELCLIACWGLSRGLPRGTPSFFSVYLF